MGHVLRNRRKSNKKRKKFSILRPKRADNAERQPEPEPEPEKQDEPLQLVEPKVQHKDIAVFDTGLSESVTTITVNFKTPELTYDAVKTFKTFYPDVPYVLVDNGGCLKSLALGRRMAHKNWVHFVSNSKNVGHGLALNQGLALVETPYAFLLDSDTVTNTGGFLEQMLAEFEDEAVFAVGWLRYVNNSGVAYRGSKGGMGMPYIHPYACLLDVEKFHSLCPFVDTGAPAIRLMRKALAGGFKLLGFPVEDYVWHKVAGTRGLFKGDCHPNTSALPGTWHRRAI